MKSFVKINLGQEVFDSNQSIKGIVTQINRKSGVAEISVIPSTENEKVLCRLSDLTIINSNPKKEKQYDYNKWFHQVEEFHKAFKHPVADKPIPLTLERTTSRDVWIVEEIIENLQSSSNNEEEFLKAYDKLLEGMEKAKLKSMKDSYTKDGVERIVAQADALTDALYFILGSFLELGVTPDEMFDIVQRSNMSKLFTDENGNKFAKYRESDGKILKSPEFFPPEPALEEEVKRQIENKSS